MMESNQMRERRNTNRSIGRISSSGREEYLSHNTPGSSTCIAAQHAWMNMLVPQPQRIATKPKPVEGNKDEQKLKSLRKAQKNLRMRQDQIKPLTETLNAIQQKRCLDGIDELHPLQTKPSRKANSIDKRLPPLQRLLSRSNCALSLGKTHHVPLEIITNTEYVPAEIETRREEKKVTIEDDDDDLSEVTAASDVVSLDEGSYSLGTENVHSIDHPLFNDSANFAQLSFPMLSFHRSVTTHDSTWGMTTTTLDDEEYYGDELDHKRWPGDENGKCHSAYRQSCPPGSPHKQRASTWSHSDVSWSSPVVTRKQGVDSPTKRPSNSTSSRHDNMV